MYQLFTHSYAGEGEAMPNPWEAYFDDYKIIKGKYLKPKGYVFCKWVSVPKDLMLVVKPSEHVVYWANRAMGYPISAAVANICVDGTIRLVFSFSTDLPGLFHDAIAGDLDEPGKEKFLNILNVIDSYKS